MLAAPAASAVIVIYHRFGEDTIPSTNIRLAQFEAHIAELTNGRYNVMALNDIVAAFASGSPLPDRTVGVTIDDAYASTYREAWPRLKRAGLSFTLFVATDPVSQGVKNDMTWAQIREIVAGGVVAVGARTNSHQHLPEQPPEKIVAAIAAGADRIKSELGTAATLFAYPYGEYSAVSAKLVEQAGFVAAFGQHSGVAHSDASRYTLPRFALNEAYGDAARFNLAVNALPFPVADLTPVDTLISARENPPAFGFSIPLELGDLGRLRCWASSGQARTERLGDRRVEVRVDKSFPVGRNRFNCTLPATDNRFRWLGVQFVVVK